MKPIDEGIKSDRPKKGTDGKSHRNVGGLESELQLHEVVLAPKQELELLVFLDAEVGTEEAVGCLP